MQTYDVSIYYDIVCLPTISYIGHTISYVKKCVYDIVYDMNLQCRAYTTYDIVCISEPTISYTICFPSDLRYRMQVIRYRRSKYDTVITYDIVPTTS